VYRHGYVEAFGWLVANSAHDHASNFDVDLRTDSALKIFVYT